MTNADRVAENRALKEDVLRSLHCAMPGKIVSFDADTVTAVIRPAVFELPLLRDVPVFMPVSLDIQEDAPCLVVFADCDIARWALQDQDANLSLRKHDLSDGIAFVGFGSINGIGNYYTKSEIGDLLSTFKNYGYSNAATVSKQITSGGTNFNCIGSFKIRANSKAVVICNQVWSSGKPNGILVSSSNTTTPSGYNTTDEAMTSRATFLNNTSSSEATYYIWGRVQSNAGTLSCSYAIIYLP